MTNITRIIINLFISNKIKILFYLCIIFLVAGCKRNDVFRNNLLQPKSRWVLRNNLDTNFLKGQDVFNRFNEDGTIDAYFLKNDKEVKFLPFEKQNLKKGWEYFPEDSILEIYEVKFRVQNIKKDYILLQDMQNSKLSYLINISSMSKDNGIK